ncbi:ketopantoate reductase C-terminal domain-containing protein [Micromonospora sp. LOL_025]|uniref:ketopantoate reductase C-terminal domain-containing protein n=1 Tax=Micromonospora sp. LOL_025 TaxID=3345413 RepID=UPI003A85D69C
MRYVIIGAGAVGGTIGVRLGQAGHAETDHLNGEIVLLGRLHGVPTPVNAAVQLAVRRALRGRIPAGGFDATELARMIG